MLLQGLIIGRALLESVRVRSERAQQLIAHGYRPEAHRRAAGTAATAAAAGHRQRRRRNGPKFATVYDDRRTLERLGGYGIRSVATARASSSRGRPPPPPADDDLCESDFAGVDWTPVCRYRRMWLAVAFAKMKIIQTAFVCLTAPPVLYAYSVGAVDFDTMLCIELLAAFSVAMLCVVTAFTRRLVGVVSASDDRNWLRMGYMNFWGYRRNAYMPLEDVVPLTELPAAKSAVWAQLRRYTVPGWYLYMPVQDLEIVDGDLFRRVFGSLPADKKDE